MQIGSHVCVLTFLSSIEEGAILWSVSHFKDFSPCKQLRSRRRRRGRRRRRRKGRLYGIR